MKLLFVSPIVSRKYCADWDAVCRGLRATLMSLSRQTVSYWKMMVIGGDEPQLPAALRQHVIFVKADLEIDRPAERGRREIDKQRKQYCGFVELHKYSPDFVMPLDYDDLVHIRLVEFVASNAGVDAFVLRKGYLYHNGDETCRYSRRIYLRTGSNLVVRYRPNLFPTEVSNFAPPPNGYLSWPFISSHIKQPERLFQSLNLSWISIPFPAVIWRRSPLSISNAFSSSSGRRTLRAKGYWPAANLLKAAKERLLSRPLDDELCREFGCDYGTELGMKTAAD